MMGMDIRQCKMCGKLFQTYGDSICMNCVDEKDRSFLLVRDYIYAHSKADVAEISEKTGVQQRWILDFLKEERLSLSSNINALKCEQCGKPIDTGRFCQECKSNLQKVFYVQVLDKNTNANKDMDREKAKDAGKPREADQRNSFSKSGNMHLNFRDK